MFRPNRIGTPLFHTTADRLDMNAWTAQEFQPIGSDNYGANIINASPLLDFGVSSLYSIATEAIAADRRFGLAMQFTVTEPIAGDAVGVEINGSLEAFLPASATVFPFFAEMNAATSGILAATTMTFQPTMFGPVIHPVQGNNNLVFQVLNYREQVVPWGGGLVGGAYCHGFQIYTPTAFNMTFFHMTASVRQLNDQQLVGYRDTLR